jgi:hypothetical protein
VWRLSDLKLLRTIVLPPGPRGSEQNAPGEPELLADGKTVLIYTFFCGLYQVNSIDTDHPSVRHVKIFDGESARCRCGSATTECKRCLPHTPSQPTTFPICHIREASRLAFDEKQQPHWIAPADDGRRIVLNSGEYGDHRLFMVNFDPQTGALTLDGRFRDPGSERTGVSMDGKSWPHGFHGDAYPHGTVFSRPVAAVKSASTRN